MSASFTIYYKINEEKQITLFHLSTTPTRELFRENAPIKWSTETAFSKEILYQLVNYYTKQIEDAKTSKTGYEKEAQTLFELAAKASSLEIYQHAMDCRSNCIAAAEDYQNDIKTFQGLIDWLCLLENLIWLNDWKYEDLYCYAS